MAGATVESCVPLGALLCSRLLLVLVLRRRHEAFGRIFGLGQSPWKLFSNALDGVAGPGALADRVILMVFPCADRQGKGGEGSQPQAGCSRVRRIVEPPRAHRSRMTALIRRAKVRVRRSVISLSAGGIGRRSR